VISLNQVPTKSNSHPSSGSNFDHEGFGKHIQASTNFDEQHTINID
jgi:hypothetical protein